MKTMKNLFYALIILSMSVISGKSLAQTSHTSLGIKGGMNVSRLSIDGLSNEENKIGYHLGAFIRLGFSDNFALEPEVLFSTKGSVVTYKTNFVSGGAVISLKYVDVPVVGLFYLTNKLNLQLGPYASYLIDANAKNQTAEQTDIASQIDKNRFKNIDYGLVAGMGLEFRSLNLGVRYLQGLKNIGTDQDFFGQMNYNFPNGKNSAWQLYVALSFL